MTNSVIPLEELVAKKASLGADITFEPNALVQKLNQYGVSGIFTTRALPEGTVLMSVPKVGGSLTPLRAFEEASELIKPLGLERFHLDETFLIASALYLRFTNEETKSTDVLVTCDDIKKEYAGSPMLCHGTNEIAQLIRPNNMAAKLATEQHEKLLEQIDVDVDLFRALSAYSRSRAWGEGVGVIPVLDWVNAASGNDANMVFSNVGSNYQYILQKAVEADEEICWDYNPSCRMITWLSYGYVDPLRPAQAYIYTKQTEEERKQLERFVIEELHLPKASVSSIDRIDPCVHDTLIKSPSLALPSNARMENHINQAIASFMSARKWYRIRAFACKKLAPAGATFTYGDLDDDEYGFGLAFEQAVLSEIRAAIAAGLAQLEERVEVFRQSRFGKTVDVNPLLEMVTEASTEWDGVLGWLEEVCQAPDLAACAEVVVRMLGQAAQPADSEGLKILLDTQYDEKPSLSIALVRQYLTGRKII